MLLTALSPCVVQFFGVCRLPEGLCIVTELCDTSLAKEIVSLKKKSTAVQSWRMMAPKMLEWMQDILSGLACLHSKEIVHGDLKPQNVLLRDGSAKLSDFGCARSMSAGPTGAEALGTIGYMSPEMMDAKESGEGAVSIEVDIFAFGTTCWSMLELKEPFEDEDAPSIFWVRNFIQTGGRLPISNGECLPILKAMILSCWEEKATSRPTLEKIRDFLHRASIEINTADVNAKT